MSKLTVESYEQLLRRSRLVEPVLLNKALAELTSKYGDRSFDTETLADHLIEARLITVWQNQMLFEGKQDSLLGGRHYSFFLGSYKLLSHLGTGGMNSVYLAEHIVMKRLVAIKVLPTAGEDDRAFLERFRLESRAIAALDHPNIVRAHDFNNDGDMYYLVMEYVEGKDLHHYVKEKGPLPYSTAAEYIRQAAEGLAHAHKAGLIHRDIKPGNLLVDRKKVVKILDLGVARLDLDETEEASITKASSQHIIGTADYLAPEQALDSHNVDARADIYSLGCTLYFLLTGHPPFPKGTIAQRMLMHQMHEPAPIYEDRPSAPVGLVEICQRMMAKKPEDRYSSAEEAGAAITEWLRTLEIAADEESVQLRARPQAADTFAGMGPGTTMGGGRKRKKQQAVQQPGDEKITCRTCGTQFGRYMYRSKCPKCGTVNHPLAGSNSPYSDHYYVSTDGSGTDCGEMGTDAGDTKVRVAIDPRFADPTVKAICPKCQTTFGARWTKCLVCGAATILADGPGSSVMVSVPNQPTGEPHDTAINNAAAAQTVSVKSEGGSSMQIELPPNLDIAIQPNAKSNGQKAAGPATRADSSTRTQVAPKSKNEPSVSTSAERSRSSSAQRSMSSAMVRSQAKKWLIAACLIGTLGIAAAATPWHRLVGDNIVERYPSGKIKLQGQFQAGVKNGLWTAWFEHGQKQWEQSYVNGVRHGRQVQFSPAGQELNQGMFESDVPQGMWIYRYDDGQLLKMGAYKEGKAHGRWTFWHPNGQKKSEGEFRDGAKIGNWTEWDDAGSLISSGAAAGGIETADVRPAK